LGGKLLRFNLTQEVAQLQSKDAWRRNRGRSSKTLVKYPDLHIVLILMKAGTQLGKHHVDGRISIQLLQGAVRAQLPVQSVPINPGDLLALEYGIPHNIEAIKESAF
jgi:quercetin dioxygenase-like cupin family protein